MMKINLYFLLLLLLSSCQLTSVSQKNIKKANFHVEIASTYLTRNKNPEAIAELTKALNLDPQNADAHYIMGLSLYERGRLNEAVSHMKESLSINPKNTKVRNDLATLYLEKKMGLEAYKEAKISSNDLTYPDPAESYFLKSQAGLLLVNKKPAMKKIVKKDLFLALKYNPSHCGALYHLGRLYAHDKQNKKSYVMFHKSLKNCNLKQDKLKALNALIPLSKKFGLVYQWGRYKQLKEQISKK